MESGFLPRLMKIYLLNRLVNKFCQSIILDLLVTTRLGRLK
jgi:hypothetical protein